MSSKTKYLSVFIIVKVKKKALLGSVLNSCSKQHALDGSSKERSERRLACCLTKQRRGEESHGAATQARHGRTCPHKILLRQTRVLRGSRCQFLPGDSSDSRHPTKMPACSHVSVMSITMVFRSAWSGCHFLKENHEAGGKQPPGLQGLSW